jgi:hypothetical protein
MVSSWSAGGGRSCAEFGNSWVIRQGRICDKVT